MPTQPAICVATHHTSIHDLLNDAEFLALANRDGCLVELRLDFFDDLSNETFCRALEVFASNGVVTYRHPLEGGKRPGVSDAERLSYLQAAANRGAKYIDIEARTPREGFDKRNSKLILSYHDFEKVPHISTLRDTIWEPMFDLPGVDVVKIALMPLSMADTYHVKSLLNISGSCDGPSTLVLCMGEYGLWTRVLAGVFGAPFTFARGEGAPGTAPGQLTWRELEELYRFREIGPNTPIYGVIGNPIGHSLSPLMHNAALKHLGEPGVYLPFKVDGDPVEFMHAFGEILSGVSVTIPHKEAIQEFCDAVEPAAQKIGAINTLSPIAKKDHENESLTIGWLGSNTDAPASADSLESALGSLDGKHVLVIGAGGAARAVAVGVMERGARVSVLNRTRERAETLARETGATAVSFDDLDALHIDAIVNTTPLGMYPKVDASPLMENQIPKGGLVFDTVYNPLRTKLLDLAAKRGCKTVEGVTMFIRQGVRQFQLWTDKRAPVDVMERVVLEALKKRQK